MLAPPYLEGSSVCSIARRAINCSSSNCASGSSIEGVVIWQLVGVASRPWKRSERL